MKDVKYIVVFVAVGLALAFAVSGPLRRPAGQMPPVGTPLGSMMRGGPTMGQRLQRPSSEIKVYAEGTISLGSDLSSQAILGRPLFIIAKAAVQGRPAGGPARKSADGPPIAVQRVDTPTFPFSYTLTNENNMIGTDFYDGDLILTARLDKDGVAGPRQPEDFEAAVEVKSNKPRQINITISR